MVFVVYITATAVGHVFTELNHVLEFLKSGVPHHRVEVWSNNRKRAEHW